MGKDIDRIRARSAMETIKESPVIVAIALAPIVVVVALAWWLVGPWLAILLLVGGGAALVFGGKFLR